MSAVRRALRKPVSVMTLRPYLGVPTALTRESRWTDERWQAEFDARVARNVERRNRFKAETLPAFSKLQAS